MEICITYTSDSNKESNSENSVLKQDYSKNSCKNACLEIGNGTSKVRNSENIEGERCANGNQAVILENRLKDSLVSKDVVNLSKRNFNDVKISLLLKGLNFFPTSNSILKLTYMLRLQTGIYNIARATLSIVKRVYHIVGL